MREVMEQEAKRKMEYNIGKALRAKGISERKFLAKDFKGARKFAVKARNYYPELEGISQMLMTIEVYISAAEERIPGTPDWYRVLGVNPLADEETIRKQYRKLAVHLHPDKNRSIGAEGAFQVVSQAWSLLSDKSKRTAYDKCCGVKFQQKGQPSYGSSEASKKNGFCDSAVSKNSAGKRNHSSKENETFWTVCHRCKMQYEYLRMYVNHNLLCPNCHEAYFAVEIDPPSNRHSKTLLQNGNCEQQKTEQQVKNMIQQAYEKDKMERKAQAGYRKQLASSRKRMSAETSSHLNASKKCKGTEDVSNRETTNSVDRGHETVSKQNSKCHVDIKQLIIQKALAEISEKLNTSCSSVTKAAVENSLESSARNTEHKLPGPCVDRKQVEQISCDVPDSDFHDFDLNRSVQALVICSNQVWAVYDDDDGMPRHYAMIQSVLSLNPFRLRIIWLRPLTHSRNSHVSWYSNGFSRTCGEFRLSRRETLNSVDCFSHSIRWNWCSSNTILIYPRKGDVWALYRNWSSDWNELTEGEAVHRYDFAEVLEDHDEVLGVIVLPLVKVAGSKAIFHRHFDPDQVQRIPIEEISRFSHQVPSHVFSGEQGLRILKGCRELDPAAVPSEVLETASSYPGDVVESSSEFMEEAEVITDNRADGVELMMPVCPNENRVANMVEGVS